MFKVLLIASFIALAACQYGLEYNNIPNPYQFSYSAQSEGGEASHQESGDGSGRVTGAYTVVNEDGSSRTVEYVADENGFRPTITTNEQGTSNQAPADVVINSSADNTGYGGAGGIQYGAAQSSGISYAPAPAISYAPSGVLPYGAAYGGDVVVSPY